MTDRERELESQVAALTVNLRDIVSQCREAIDHHYGLPNRLVYELTGFEHIVENAPDTGREWVADARAVGLALHRAGCYVQAEGRDEEWYRAAHLIALRRGWTEEE